MKSDYRKDIKGIWTQNQNQYYPNFELKTLTTQVQYKVYENEALYASRQQKNNYVLVENDFS